MPDITKKTISATESPALFNVSPYITKWMLYKKFADGLGLDGDESSRMSWGKKLQPLIIQQAAEDLHLEVRPNVEDTYHRRGLLGCTRDATIICPDRGPGALETKCVFDYRTWMTDWNGGKNPPRQHEIQLQQQMLVGDGHETEAYRWGVIAAWVAGDIYYFERKPIHDLWRILVDEADLFFGAVAAGEEPDPFGVPVELPWLTALFPVDLGNPLDLTADPEGEKIAEAASLYRHAKDQESGGAKMAEPLRAKLLAIAKSHDELILPAGVRVRIRPHGKGKAIKVFVPDLDGIPTAKQGVPSDILMAG